MSNTTAVCDRCKKPLKNQTCSACDGKGFYREWLFFKKECDLCRGSGWTLRCPDEFNHILEDFNISRKVKPNQIYQSFRKTASITPLSTPTSNPIKPTPKQPVPPQIPPPWHPAYPNPWHPMNPRSLSNPNNPNSPLNPNNPMNLNSPRHPLNPNNPINRNPFKK